MIALEFYLYSHGSGRLYERGFNMANAAMLTALLVANHSRYESRENSLYEGRPPSNRNYDV